MAQGQGFLRTSVRVFAILAWVSLGIQVIVGMAVLVLGGPPVPIGGAELPARVVGLLNFLAAAIYWFLFTYLSRLTKLLLEIHSSLSERVRE
jgi:heme A synthase